jgi:hypothetical protein
MPERAVKYYYLNGSTSSSTCAGDWLVVGVRYVRYKSCRGGDRAIEKLVFRMAKSARGAIRLFLLGFYDESLMLSAQLAHLASNRSTARLVEIWNNLPGVTPAKKFADRKTGVGRTWKALQRSCSGAGADRPR